MAYLGTSSTHGHHDEEIVLVPLDAAGTSHLNDALVESSGVLATYTAFGSFRSEFLASFLNQLLHVVHQELIIMASTEDVERDLQRIGDAELDVEEIAENKDC